ncbi:PspC domain-containing protein [Shouchella sp. JSM 1781072]|uniref:PspC domain-containing protein n=1 Tax=Bacillaceae TaxID=186817 RepID=UPI0020D09274|nr:PspC domain-containing protein [Alkalihalobacillus sp. LMS6]UTR07161.1 PspC domain-containing protein [Alkalihalobacillus sp. LMS6]
MKRKLMKAEQDRVISGVCGGIADHLGIPSLAVRLIFLVIPANVLIYVILAMYLETNPVI